MMTTSTTIWTTRTATTTTTTRRTTTTTTPRGRDHQKTTSRRRLNCFPEVIIISGHYTLSWGPNCFPQILVDSFPRVLGWPVYWNYTESGCAGDDFRRVLCKYWDVSAKRPCHTGSCLLGNGLNVNCRTQQCVENKACRCLEGLTLQHCLIAKLLGEGMTKPSRLFAFLARTRSQAS